MAAGRGGSVSSSSKANDTRGMSNNAGGPGGGPSGPAGGGPKGPSSSGPKGPSASTGAGYSGPKGTPSGGLNSAARNASAAPSRGVGNIGAPRGGGLMGGGYSGPKGTPSGGLNTAARAASAAPSRGLGALGAQGGMRPGGYSGPKGVASQGLNRAAREAATPTYSGPKGVGALNTSARFAAANRAGFKAPSVPASRKEVDLMGRMMLAESGSIRNRFGKPQTAGLQAVADVVRNRVLSAKFPNTVMGVLTEKNQFSPLNNKKPSQVGANFSPSSVEDAKRVAASVLSGETPTVVGGSLNYGNLHAIANPQTVKDRSQRSGRKSRDAFASMTPEATFVDAKNPSRQHSFGTIGKTDVSFNGYKTPSASPQVARAPSPAGPRAQAVPQPNAALSREFRDLVASLAPKGRPSTFPARPEIRGAFPAEDRQPSTFPARPEVPGALPAARPMTSFPGRPGFPGAFPAEDRQPSTFPGRPGMPGAFPAATPSTFPGRPEFPGSFPAASAPPSTFPGRPSYPGAFPAEDRAPSTFPGRPEFKGSFPAAQPTPEDDPMDPIASYDPLSSVQAPGAQQVAQAMPGQPPGAPMDLTQVQQQQATLIGVLKQIMGRGGPKNPREEKLVMKIARALQATGLGGGMDYTLTEATI